MTSLTELAKRFERTDVHRPSVIEPADYEWVGYEYLKADPYNLGVIAENRNRIRAHMARTGGTYSRHAHGGSCHVCGASAVYTALFYHGKSNSYIRTGLDCAHKLECYGAERFRKAVAFAREAVAGKRKAEAILTDAGNGAALAIYNATGDERAGFAYEESTITNIVGKLIKYGSITPKAMNFVGALLERIDKRATIAAKREAEKEAALPIPAELNGKRAKVRGEVLTVKAVDTRFGPAVKMLVKHDDGWKLWGTRPRDLEGAARGDVVEFEAKIEVSRDDPKFGFFSRPTKAGFISRVPDKIAA